MVQATAPGFVADPGTIQNVGELPVLTARLDAPAKALGVIIYGSAASLYRPFDPRDDPNNPEVNHIQLIPAGGAGGSALASGWSPDPRCQ